MFQIFGKGYEIDRERVVGLTKNVMPNPSDGRNKHYVDLHGRTYPIKQVIHLVTGLPHIAFTAQHAHRILDALGFEIYQPAYSTEIIREGSADRPHDGTEIVKFGVVLERDEDGLIVASCPALVGCHSQGKTRDQALSNIREAIRGYVASMRKHGEPLPPNTEVAEVEVPV